MPYGVFVEFPHGLVGLAPKSAMCDKFVTSTGDHFVMGQTVVAKVTNLDEEKQRVLLSLKVSECCSEDAGAESLALLSQCLQEQGAARDRMANRDDSEVIQNLAKLTPGHKLQLAVEEVRDDGTARFMGNQVTGATVVANCYHLEGASVVLGQKVRAVVLHIDFLSLEVHVSLRQELVNARPKELQDGSQQLAVVQHVSHEFAIISLAKTGQLAAVPVATHLNDTFRFESEKLSVGQSLTVFLKTAQPGGGGLLLALPGTAKGRPVQRAWKRSESVDDTATRVKHALCVGNIVTGTVKAIKATRALVALDNGVTGSVHASEILDELPANSVPTSQLKVGQQVTARVIGGMETRTHKFLPITHTHFTLTIPELSLRKSKVEEEWNTSLSLQGEQLSEKLKSYQPGQTLTCFVFKYNSHKKWLEVEVTPDVRGKVELLLLSLNPKILKHPGKEFRVGQALTATVIGPDPTKTHLFLSLTDFHSLVKGAVTLGTVKTVTPQVGLTVTLPLRRNGLVGLFDLADCYEESSLAGFKEGRTVRCCVISSKDDKIHLSLRKSRTHPEVKSQVTDADLEFVEALEKGQKVRGFVKSVREAGVFIDLSAFVTGRVQFQHLTNYFVSDHTVYEKHLPAGKLVTAAVLSVSKKQKKVELSLAPEHTGKPDVIPESLKLPLKESKEKRQEGPVKWKGKRKKGNSESEQDASQKKMKKKKKRRSLEEEDSGVEVYFREEEEEEEDAEEPKKAQKQREQSKAPRLQVSSGFSWDVQLSTLGATQEEEEEESSDSDEESNESKTKKKSRKEKELEKQQEEKELSRIEAGLIDPTRRPQTADDFDRLALSSPNSSIVWLQYMAFHLHATEVEKARAVAERALKTISFREEQEKMNVWGALLNLENLYGTQETLKKVFDRALQYNEPLKVFQQLADIYTKSDKHKQADNLYNTMVKRFRQEKSVWLKYASFLLKGGQVKAARVLLQRALKCLPDKEHVDTIVKFAQLEFRFGDAEHAKAMFESTLSNYPKRTDLWSVYLDMMIKHGSQKEVRYIFERLIHTNLAAKRMKFVFKRYLDYEKKYGTPESTQAVKEKALEYVESRSSLAESRLNKHTAAAPDAHVGAALISGPDAGLRRAWLARGVVAHVRH
nr:PREDICTED: protein RRP5 homolog [Latimeria chalumnae]|eukprot:XP_014354054.1 PREDICTED: protein RRP5 homolog [Latimeria chalumnae]